MPIDVFAEVGKYAVYDTGIGSDMPSVNNHFEKTYRFVAESMNEEALTELYNMHNNLHFMISKISIDSLSFACFVQSLKGQEVKDYSESNLKRIVAELAAMGLTRGMVEEQLADLKKKLIAN